jgi:hypothetical protein
MEFDPEDLSREKNLLAIRIAARKVPSSRFNRACVATAAALSVVYVLLTGVATPVLAQRTRELAEMGFNFTIGILGFLIAGFTVFATITKEELFQAMAVVPHKPTGLSTLKYNLFSFMRVFIDYLCFCSYCVAVKILASPGGPLAEIVGGLPGGAVSKGWLARIGFALTITLIVYVLVVLKSFVFNVYNFVITTVQWSFLRKPFSLEEFFGIETTGDNIDEL